MKNCKTGPKFYYEDIQKYTGICFQSNSRMQFLRVKKGCSAIVFSDTKKKKKNACQKICKGRQVFGCVAGACYFECRVS